MKINKKYKVVLTKFLFFKTDYYFTTYAKAFNFAWKSNHYAELFVKKGKTFKYSINNQGDYI